MTRVLFICDSRPCAHDYGADFLIQGAYALLGADNVIEYPEKPNLHLNPLQGRDACQIDSDAWLPAKGLPAETIRSMATVGEFDLIVMTGAYGTATPWQEVCGSLPASTPVVALHYDDERDDTRPLLRAIMGRRETAYFHREGCPDDAHQLWLSQPASRVRPVEHKPNLRPVMFLGAQHNSEDTTRQRLVESVRAAVPDAVLDVTPDQRERRLPPEVYRDRLWESAVSVVWTSSPTFRVWDSNRFWESCALGCAIVAELPHEKQRLRFECVTWIDCPESAGDVVKQYMALTPFERQFIQLSNQQTFLATYTSEKLTERILWAAGLSA